MTGVRIRDLRIQFGAQAVIEGLDLDIEPGEFLVLLGPSGCGKSTLLHSIAGLVDVTGGRIEIGGEDMTDADPSERHIGMVFQSYALYPTMNVERNLSFGLRVHGMPRPEIDRRVAEAAQMLQLQPLLRRKPAQLSGGQRQRVAIGRALVRQAQVYLLDEPLSNLDAQLRTELRRELKVLHRKLGATMVYVTHDQVEAMTLASRIVVMRQGHIQQIGPPAEVYARPGNVFVAGFLGSPGMNLLPGQLRRANSATSFEGALRLALPESAVGSAAKDGQDVLLGVRPEHLTIDSDGTTQGRVTLVEPMGNHQVVWLDVAGQSVACLGSGELRVALDDQVGLSVQTEHINVFDRSSGVRL